MDKDHLPTVDIDLGHLEAKDRVLLKATDELKEDDMLLLSAKERVDLAKFKVSEIKRQMKDTELKEKQDLAKESDLLGKVEALVDFKQLVQSKQLKYINDLCNEISKNPKTDLDRLEILQNVCDNRLLENIAINKVAMCSMTLVLRDISPD